MEYISQDEIIKQLQKDLVIKVVDNGIGAYEYWGQKCVDKRMEPEIQSDEEVDVYIPGGFYDSLTLDYRIDEDIINVKAIPIKTENDIVTFRLEL